MFVMNSSVTFLCKRVAAISAGSNTGAADELRLPLCWWHGDQAKRLTTIRQGTGRLLHGTVRIDPLFTAPDPARAVGDPAEVERALAGRRIEAVERRGKYLLLRLDSGQAIAMHLRMTGNLVLSEAKADPPYLRASMTLDDGLRLLFTDARRFGQAVVLEGDRLDDYFASRSRPVAVTTAFFHARRRRARPRRR